MIILILKVDQVLSILSQAAALYPLVNNLLLSRIDTLLIVTCYLSIITNCYVGNDRKKEAASGSSFMYVPQKKPKLAHVGSHQRQPSSSAEAWEVLVIDTDPADFVPMALEANDNDEGDKVIGIICGAIKTLKNQRWKPDTLLYMGLLYLAKLRPSIFSNDCILHALSSLLRRDQNNQNSYKSKVSPLVPVLAANLLMKGFHDKKNWPEVFVKVIYLQSFIMLV